jgi:hypothetical protein
MENKIFLDKVVEFIVRDTRIDYEKEEIQFPFPYYLSRSLRFSPLSFSSKYLPLELLFPSPFPKYCKDVYGLTNQEIRYVWDQYKDIITDKIENER